MSDMATMPIPELVAGIREKTESMQPLQAMVLGVLAGRLMKEYERAEGLIEERDIYAEKAAGTCVIQKVIDALGPQTLTSVENYKRMDAAVQEVKELRGQVERHEEIFDNAVKIRTELEERIDNCEYQKCPCR